MKKNTYSLFSALLLSVLLISFKNEHKNNIIKMRDGNYTISGTAIGIKSGVAYLRQMDSAMKMVKLDSAKVVDEKFNFSGSIKNPMFCFFSIKDNAQSKTGFMSQTELILDAGNLTIVCNKDAMNNLKASGTKGQDEFNAFKQKINPIYNELNALYRKKSTIQKQQDKNAINALTRELNASQKKFNDAVLAHVKLYPSSKTSAIIVKQNLTSLDQQTIDAAYQLFTADVKNSSYAGAVYKKLLAENRTAVGMMAPSFTLPSTTGKMVSLANYKGKITLVDFWASWCGPCRAENPNLIKAYAEYKNKGFEILGVSMDDNKEKWLAAIKEDKLPWMQISDLKGTKSELKTMYGIISIPMNVLLDKDGKIIARNLRGKEVQQTLVKYLN